MTTECYSMVRGSAIRVTGLDRRGRLPDPIIQSVVSKSVAKVTIEDVVEGGSNEMLRNDDDERRMLLVKPGQTIRYVVSIDFLRVDPGVLSLVAGASLVYRDSPGFGEVPFGISPFGGSPGTVVGFDSKTRIPATAFALEVWSKLANERCSNVGFDMGGFDEDGFDALGTRRWGYTLFPFLKGGRLSGFSFANGLVSFNLRQAQTRRGSGWGVGPYDVNGLHQRLLTPVSGNVNWRQFLTDVAPPEATDGIVEFTDSIEGGTASMTTEDVLDGGSVVTSPWIIEGGRA